MVPLKGIRPCGLRFLGVVPLSCIAYREDGPHQSGYCYGGLAMQTFLGQLGLRLTCSWNKLLRVLGLAPRADFQL